MPQRAAGEPAPLARRLAALCYESLLLTAVLFCASIPVAALESATALPHVRLAYQIYLAVFAAVYFIWQWLHGGKTLAMRTWHLELRPVDGGALTLRHAIVRYMTALAMPGFTFVWALVDRERLFLHDRLAGTRIVCSFSG